MPDSYKKPGLTVRHPGASALFLGLLLLAGLLALQAFRSARENALLNDSRIVLDVFAARLGEYVQGHINAAELVRDTWARDGEISRDPAASLIRHYSGYQAIQWMDGAGVIRWNYPEQGNRAALGLQLKRSPETAHTLALADRRSGPAVSQPLNLAQGGRGIVVYYRIAAEPPGGYLGAVFRVEPFIEQIIHAPLRERFHLEIADARQPIYGQMPASVQPRFISENRIRIANREWELRLAPRDPEALLNRGLWLLAGGGVLVCLIVVLLTWSILNNIRVRIRAEQETWRAANLHPLSGLPNRRLLDRALRKCIDGGGGHALLLVNVSGLRLVNSVHGTETGDTVLLEIGERLRRLPHAAALHHLSDGEFALLLPGADETFARMLADGARQACSAPIPHNGSELQLSCTIGIALIPQHGTTPAEIHGNASAALVDARQGDGCHVFDEELQKRRVREFHMTNELRHALERGEIHLVYQPIVDLQTGELHAFESLMRWQHHEMGAIPPGVFIPLAEASGLIDDLGHWALRHASRTVGEWNRRHGLAMHVGINLSPGQLLDVGLPDTVERTLTENGFPADLFVLEITESLLIRNLDVASHSLERLKQTGVSIALDDFGTGYSSLSYLAQLPLTSIKLDNTFMQRASADRRTANLLVSIIELARVLDLKVVAEGVETFEQLTMLRRHGCHYAQGYYLARPLPAAEAETLIGKHWPLDG